MEQVLIDRLTKIAKAMGYDLWPDGDGWMEIYDKDDDTTIVAYHLDAIHHGHRFTLGFDIQEVGPTEFAVWDKNESEDSHWMFIREIPRDMFTLAEDIRLTTAKLLLKDIQKDGYAHPDALQCVDKAIQQLELADIGKMEEHRLGLLTELEMLIDNGVAPALNWHQKMRVIDGMIASDDFANDQDTEMLHVIEEVLTTIK